MRIYTRTSKVSAKPMLPRGFFVFSLPWDKRGGGRGGEGVSCVCDRKGERQERGQRKRQRDKERDTHAINPFGFYVKMTESVIMIALVTLVHDSHLKFAVIAATFILILEAVEL